MFFFFFSSRRRHTRSDRDWSSDVCSSDLVAPAVRRRTAPVQLPGGRRPWKRKRAAGLMATPSPRAPRTVSRPSAGTTRRGIVVLAGVLGILFSALPAQAAPTTAAQAAQLMAARSHDLEVLSEKFDTAGVRLAAEEATAKAATARMQKATATLGRAQ